MKIFFCNSAVKDKYGKPNKSSYLITFEELYLGIKFPYENPDGEASFSGGPRDHIISDEQLIRINHSLLSGKEIPLKFRHNFIEIAFGVNI